MRILVTGANGFLGRSLLAQEGAAEWVGCGRGAATVGAPYWRLELTDRDAVAALVDEVAPDWVVNAAAMTNVDQCEADADAARRANVEIVDHLVTVCGDTGVGLVQISTDYVFDGAAGPYAEGDATNPLSNYGRLKLESESLLWGLERALVVRTLWLYGYVPGTGANFTIWSLKTLAAGAPLRVFADQWGNPTYVPDLARTLIELCQAEASGLFHMGGATFMTRHDLALALADFFDLDSALVQPVPTGEVGLKAERPLRSGLKTDTLEAILGRRPLDFFEGLERMVGDPDFRHGFPQFAR